MSKTTWKRAGVALTAAALVAGLAGCNDDGGDKKAAGGKADASAPAKKDGGDATQVLRAAYEKTSAAKAAKIKATITTQGTPEESGTIEMSGVQGWAPATMDVTMKGSMLGAGTPGAPEQMRVVMLDNAMYMDMGAEQAAQMDGKRWMKMDLKSIAEASGDKALQKQMTGNLDSMNQDPAQQLGLLLESPDLKHVGPEKVNGMETRHYKGTLTFEQMLKSNDSAKVLPKEDYDKLIENVKKTGLKGYDMEIWVNEDNYPARMKLGMKMDAATVHMTMDYSDYGTKSAVQAPPAAETVDLFKMLQEAGAGAGAAAGAQG